MPAITTCCQEDLTVDHEFVARHVVWVIENGCTGAFPKESVALFEAAQKGETERVFEIYRCFLPLLRMDTVPKFVQLIKLVQEEVGMGSARVRPPRLEVVGAELAEARRIVAEALANNPCK